MSINNSIKCNSDSQQWAKTPLMDTNVKLAGEEAKDRLYEPKHKKKMIRVFTVIAYMFFVSLAAIMLSLYYVFLWNGNQKDMKYKHVPATKCEQTVIVQHVESFPQQSMNYDGLDNNILSQSEDVSMTTEDEFSWPLETTTAEYNSADFVKTVKRSKFLQKLMFKSSIDDYLMQQDQQQQRSV